MTRRPAHFRNLWPAVAITAVALGGDLASSADPPAPLLQQLSDETQRVYSHARLGMVRVRLPTPQWLIRQNQLLLEKWGSQLSPATREQLLELQERDSRSRTATGPSTAPVPGWPSTAPTGLTVANPPPPDRVLVATGLQIDAAGHAVFPLYVDRSDLRGPLAALTGDGRATVAAFVGSDRITNLTVLQLADPGGHPADFGPPESGGPLGRPPDGSLAMVIAPDGSARLTVWTAASADVGLVIRPNGSFAGFGFADDFLSAATARPIVDQLVATGIVRRPKLGMTGRPVGRAELFFDTGPPAGPSAVRVTAVDPDSAAARAGMLPADVIVSVAGQSVGPRTIAAVIAACRGATVIRVCRAGEMVDLTVDLHLD
jgi:hypothetical protein